LCFAKLDSRSRPLSTSDMSSTQRRRQKRAQRRLDLATATPVEPAVGKGSVPLLTRFRPSQAVSWLVTGHRKTDKFALYFGGVVLAIAVGLFINWLQKALTPAAVPDVSAPVGRLTPAQRGTKSQDGPISFFMGSIQFNLHPVDGRVVPIRVNGKPAIWVDYSAALGARLSGDFYREDGRLVAQLRDNSFTVNENGHYKIKPRSDRHGLTVLDDAGITVLDVEFLTERSFRIEGRLHSPKYGQVTIKRDEIVAQRKNLSSQYQDMQLVDVPLDI
jgi:hypothetical protein